MARGDVDELHIHTQARVTVHAKAPQCLFIVCHHGWGARGVGEQFSERVLLSLSLSQVVRDPSRMQRRILPVPRREGPGEIAEQPGAQGARPSVSHRHIDTVQSSQ